MQQSTIKCVFDFVVSSLALLVLSPLLILLVFLVRLKLGSPILFTQQRPGLNGHPFTIYKFRTMTNARDSKGDLFPDDQRLTSFGKFLRSTSLDELPELWNVLKGDMSLVGPRPLLMEYLPRYTPKQMRRHDVRPGITGWAQINGRNNLSWKEKFEMDIWYVDNISLKLDLTVLWQTIIKVLRRADINQTGSATAEKFMGNP